MRALKTLICAVTLALLPLMWSSTPARAQPSQRCFAETKQCISGRFRQYWEQNGGLAVFGYPISPMQAEVNRDTGQTYQTQWFERNRFELHPENKAPYDVLLGRLGDDRLLLMARDWFVESNETAPASGCLWFARTGHNVCNQSGQRGFKAYWQSHGLEFDGRSGASYAESLALFGYPLTGAREETNASGDRVITQWFERARFEWHPGKADQFKVLLGLLGDEVRLGVGSPASTYYFEANALYERTFNGTIRREADVPALGKVIDMLQTGSGQAGAGSLLVLRANGVQRIIVPNGMRSTLVGLDQPTRYGRLVPDAEHARILYESTHDDAKSRFGLATDIGMIDMATETARHIVHLQQATSVLGFTADGTGVYVIRRGQDPAFTMVEVIDVSSGVVTQQLDVSGEGPAVLSPTARTLATLGWRSSGDQVIRLYNVPSPGKGPNEVALPIAHSQIQSMYWSSTPRRLYVTLFATYKNGDLAQRGGVWELDTRAGTWTQIASDIAMDSAISGVSSDGRWISLREPTSMTIIDLIDHWTIHRAVPDTSVVAR